MGNLVIDHKQVTPEKAKELVEICPFGAMTYNGSVLEISSACRVCKMCVKKSGGIVTYEEDGNKGLDKSQWKGVCVFVQHHKGKIHPVAYELCGKAKELAAVTGHEVYALVLGYGMQEQAQQLLHYGVDKVFVYDEPQLADFRIEPYTAAFYDFIEKIKPSSILVGATSMGRQLAPRVAARCRTGLTADCTRLEMKENTDLVQIRPAFGGNIMAQIVSPNTRPQFCTVRYKVFDEIPMRPEAKGEVVHMCISADQLNSAIEVLSVSEKPKEVDIAEAEVIVAVGRGAQSETVCAYARELADLLGGMVACTRPLVENNLFDSKHQIGLSGRTVKPKLIICLGISGAVQFAAGMKASDCIVAINTDKNAPIFDVAHYAIVADAAQILPELIQKIKSKG